MQQLLKHSSMIISTNLRPIDVVHVLPTQRQGRCRATADEEKDNDNDGEGRATTSAVTVARRFDDIDPRRALPKLTTRRRQCRNIITSANRFRQLTQQLIETSNNSSRRKRGQRINDSVCGSFDHERASECVTTTLQLPTDRPSIS